nr:immunoglobulin light chain junction region [Macaca mulatta]MOY09338.1 immunoglobulin light chain junction region [Macaca mulatta]MOY10104.1 immunoglobulin light chain junction region [Macaca mulatta]MOY10186.1 immunoglobulin light chain junction region [Macaca mulatta]
DYYCSIWHSSAVLF